MNKNLKPLKDILLYASLKKNKKIVSQVKSILVHDELNKLEPLACHFKLINNSELLDYKDFLKAKGINVCSWGDAIYPASFYKSEVSPLLFFYKGEPLWVNNKKKFLIVGSRKPHPGVLDWMDEVLSEYLENNKGVIVLSGGARGVDQKSHNLALKYSIKTMVGLPSGFLNIYPKSLTPLLGEILNQGGCAFSPFFPDEIMFKSNFHYRNYLLAQMCDYSLIVQAGFRSGTYVTAKYCMNLNKKMGVIPGDARSLGFKGSHQLIQSGADLVSESYDIII